MDWLQRLPWRSLGRWWVVGLAFFGTGTGLLYVCVGLLGMPLLAATVLSAEINQLIRFFITDRWVFGHRRPTWNRLWQFHVASVGGALIWWAVTNILSRFGIHYLIASVAGTGCSVFFSMWTNFLWIWRRPEKPVAIQSAAPRGSE
jgi:dolichol-phosphate mannosyltransferase